MNASPSLTTRTVTTRCIRVTIDHDSTSRHWAADISLRGIGGIYRWSPRGEGDPPAIAALCMQAYMRGTFAPRPYRLAQSDDGRSGACVLTLVADFCAFAGLSAEQLYSLAYPQEPPCDEAQWAAWRAQAEWEGIERPRTWDSTAIAGLVRSLEGIGWLPLADLIRRHGAP